MSHGYQPFPCAGPVPPPTKPKPRKPVCYQSTHGRGERLWRCTRVEFPFNKYTNPIGYGINASEALTDYIRQIT